MPELFETPPARMPGLPSAERPRWSSSGSKSRSGPGGQMGSGIAVGYGRWKASKLK